jgi:hypothetical protein
MEWNGVELLLLARLGGVVVYLLLYIFLIGTPEIYTEYLYIIYYSACFGSKFLVYINMRH